MLCVLQGQEAMLSAMVDVAEALVTDMFQAKTCYRKIFSVWVLNSSRISLYTIFQQSKHGENEFTFQSGKAQ